MIGNLGLPYDVTGEYFQSKCDEFLRWEAYSTVDLETPLRGEQRLHFMGYVPVLWVLNIRNIYCK